MNTIVKHIAVAILIFSALTTNGQNKIYDVITLKDDMGSIMGFIDEQILDENPAMLITPVNALFKINVDDIEGGRSKTVDVNGETRDLLVLKNSGEEIVGDIVSESFGKWYKIHTTDLLQRSYLYSDILKISKELVDGEDSIFEAYGVLESITLDNGIRVSGVVVEQELGVSITVKDVKDGMDKIIDVSNISKIDKTAYQTNVNIFDQYAYVDIVNTTSQSLKGVIVSQKLGESVILHLLDSNECSAPIPYSQILSIGREINNSEPRTEPIILVDEVEDIAIEKAEEAIAIQDDSYCNLEVGSYVFESDLTKEIESYPYRITNDAKFIVLDGAQMILSDIFRVGESYSFVLKVDGWVESIIPSFKIWDLSTNIDRQTKYIEIDPKKKKRDKNIYDTVGVRIESERYNDDCILVTLTPNSAGEYAITYLDCTSAAIFKVE